MGLVILLILGNILNMNIKKLKMMRYLYEKNIHQQKKFLLRHIVKLLKIDSTIF